MSQTAQPQQHPNTDVAQLLALRDPKHPTRKPPRLVHRLLPDPLASYEQWQRFAGEDLATMTPAARQWESHRIRVAAALVDDDARLPTWLLARLERLAS